MTGTLTLVGTGTTIVTKWDFVESIKVDKRDDGEGYRLFVMKINGDVNEIDHITPEQMEVNIERLQEYGAEGLF